MIVDWDGTGAPVVSWREREVAFSPSSTSFSSSDNREKKGSRDLSAYQSKPLPPLPTTTISSSTPTIASSPSHYNDAFISKARNPVAYYQPQRPCSPLIPQPQQQQQPHPLFTASYYPPRYSPTTKTHHAAYVAGYDASAYLSYDYDGRVVHVHRRGQQQQHGKSSARLSAHSDYFSMDLEKYSRGVEVQMAGGEEDEDGDNDEVGSRKKSRRSVGKFVEKVLYKLEEMGILWRLKEDRKKVMGGNGKGKGGKMSDV